MTIRMKILIMTIKLIIEIQIFEKKIYYFCRIF